MKKYLIAVLLLIYTLPVCSQGESEAQVQISHENKKVIELTPGDITKLIIRVWPCKKACINDFEKIEETFLLGHIYVSRIVSKGVSPNNNEVFELKILGVIMRPFNVGGVHLLTLANATYVTSFLKIKVNPKKLKLPKKYFVLDQEVNEINETSLLLILIAVLFVLTALVTAFIVHKKIKGKMDKQETTKKEIEKWNTLFISAKDREDYQDIYNKREDWCKYVERIHVEKLENYVETIQYKRVWSGEDLFEVRQLLGSMRPEMRENGIR